jgi:hypothetical protein
MRGQEREKERERGRERERESRVTLRVICMQRMEILGQSCVSFFCFVLWLD